MTCHFRLPSSRVASPDLRVRHGRGRRPAGARAARGEHTVAVGAGDGATMARFHYWYFGAQNWTFSPAFKPSDWNEEDRTMVLSRAAEKVTDCRQDERKKYKLMRGR